MQNWAIKSMRNGKLELKQPSPIRQVATDFALCNQIYTGTKKPLSNAAS
jgi:hypothetical protein